MFDDQDGCEWVNISSGTGPPELIKRLNEWKENVESKGM